MMSRLLALIGVLMLCGAAASASYWALTVTQQQPALPDLATPERTAADTGASKGRPTSRRQRPEVFYAAIIERPLFAPSRRPALPEPEVQIVVQEEAPTPAPEPETPPPPQLGLLGVMGNADSNRALVSNAGGDPVWISAGTTIAGWTVEAIGTDWLELTLENETIRIEMYQQ